jgi:5-hydroxyisourate hydrolase-like protein (transthyretin family)
LLFGHIFIPMDSFDAIDEFVMHWQQKAGLDFDADGNCRFKCLVSYKWDIAQEVFQTRATIIRGGLDDGKIALDETAELDSGRYQLEFMAHRSRIAFDRRIASLLVSGKSAAMGSYQVRFTPRSPTPEVLSSQGARATDS